MKRDDPIGPIIQTRAENLNLGHLRVINDEVGAHQVSRAGQSTRTSRHQPHLAQVVAQSQAETTLAHRGLGPQKCVADAICESPIDAD